MGLLERLSEIGAAAEGETKSALEGLLAEIRERIESAKKAYEEDGDAFLGDGLSGELSFFGLVF